MGNALHSPVTPPAAGAQGERTTTCSAFLAVLLGCSLGYLAARQLAPNALAVASLQAAEQGSAVQNSAVRPVRTVLQTRLCVNHTETNFKPIPMAVAPVMGCVPKHHASCIE